LSFDSEVLKSRQPMGQVNSKTGRLTFTSSCFFSFIFFLVGLMTFTIFLTQMIVFTTTTQKGHNVFLFLMVIPAIFMLVSLLFKKHTVEFDDFNKIIVMKSWVRAFCGCASRSTNISYNDIKDINVELFNGHKSNVVVELTNGEKVYLLANQNNWTGNGFTIFYNQTIVAEMRAHLTKVTHTV